MEHSEHDAVVGVDSSAAGTAANIVVVASKLVGTAADMAVVTTVGEEIGQTEVLVVHGVLGTAGTVAEHKDPRTLVALLHVVAACDAEPHILSRPGD